MVVYEWFDRLLGQTIAPDEKYDPDAQERKTPSIFDTLAPDPNFAPANTKSSPFRTRQQQLHNSPPPAVVFQTAAALTSTPSLGTANDLILCQKCGQMTPVSASQLSTSTRPKPPNTGTTRFSSSTDLTPAQVTTPGFVSTPSVTRTKQRSPTRRTPRRASATKPYTTPLSTRATPGGSTTTKKSRARSLMLSPELSDRLADAAAETSTWKVNHSDRRHCFDKADAFLNKFLLPAKSRDALSGAAGYVQDMELMIQKDPWLLTDVRTTSRRSTGANCPEGYTPLMAAVFVNHVPAVRLFLKYIDDPDLLLKVNLQGQQAVHIACHFGHDQILHLLQEACERLLGSNELLEPDIFGQTPLATALTSPNLKAVNIHRELFKQPWTRKDPSVFGDVARTGNGNEISNYVGSLYDRVGFDLFLQLQSGHAEMPGRRGYMEDVIMIHYLEENDDDNSFSNFSKAAMYGVLDGHDDAGYVAHFVAQRLEQEFHHLVQAPSSNLRGSHSEQQQDQILTDALPNDLKTLFITIDAELKEKSELKGGSTAVVAFVTKYAIIVANVGDSRCVLVQQHPAATDGVAVDTVDDLANQLSKLSADESKQPNKRSTNFQARVNVIQMSQDHKPNLEGERSRVESIANMQVREVKYEQDGKEMVVHKIVKTDKNGDKVSSIGMSRAFGDHEFKRKKDVPPQEQAVIAKPDVVVRKRNNDTDTFLILASDGIWDVMSNEEVGQFVSNEVDRLIDQGQEQYVLPAVADLLINECFRLGSVDNMSVVIVALGDVAGNVAAAAHTNDTSVYKTPERGS